MKAAIIVLFFAALSGCATQKELIPTGGSRADGVVYLSFDYGWLEKPQVDWETGVREAAQRCSAWGYTGAEPFGGKRTKCEASNEYGCMRFMVTAAYQCTGTPPASR